MLLSTSPRQATSVEQCSSQSFLLVILQITRSSVASSKLSRPDCAKRQYFPAFMATSGPVQQTLKSAPFFLLCAALNQDVHIQSEISLLQFLAAFKAEEIGVRVGTSVHKITMFSRSKCKPEWEAGLTGRYCGCWYCGRCESKRANVQDALLVLHVPPTGAVNNTAHRMTEPMWAGLRDRCYAMLAFAWLTVGLFASSVPFPTGRQCTLFRHKATKTNH